MKIQSGHAIMATEKDVEGKFVRFIDDDGRCLFEVHICDEPGAIEVRGSETHKINGKIHTEALMIEPRFSNSIRISTKPWIDKD